MSRILNLVKTHYNKAASMCNLNPKVYDILAQPKNEIKMNFPVKLSDNSLKVFSGFRVQHNDILGPYKGGLRFFPNVSLDESSALASWMTLKCSLQGLPFGGGKGGLDINPNDYNEEDLQRITRAFARELYPYIGNHKDIPAPDVGTNAQIMDWMVDEYNVLSGNDPLKSNMKSVFTGKSIEMGGSQGREEATGRGVALNIIEWSKNKNIELKGKSFIVQGFGNVGYYTSSILSSLGMSLIGVGDHTGYLHSSEGFNVHKLKKHNDLNKSLEGYGAGKKISKEEFFKIETDIVIPAALELQIGKEEAENMKCQLVVEAANGPIDTEGDEILLEKGVDIIPDILANSGGVEVSYYEWLQNKSDEYWSKDKVQVKLENKMMKTFDEVYILAKTMNCDLRTASYIHALRRLEKNYLRRGI
ncbi:Glutamate/Leucine/Phenylalanine/Valine dehydrogenase [seawater metagenome]|uniref:Glutamate/Leucine/Phenylalanine/Valine dehydrogenase n=1 Tax=seawater metagenome TaxID=1561972 RepID=A0A5E8CIS4_9ZZZZ